MLKVFVTGKDLESSGKCNLEVACLRTLYTPAKQA